MHLINLLSRSLFRDRVRQKGLCAGSNGARSKFAVLESVHSLARTSFDHPKTARASGRSEDPDQSTQDERRGDH